MTKRSWSRLTTFLTSEPEASTVLSFQQIERILGHSLPASARRHAAFWSNTAGYSFAWRDAGREVSRRGLLPEQIRFLQRYVVSDALRAQFEAPPIHVAAETTGIQFSVIGEPNGTGLDQYVDVLLLGCVQLEASSQQLATDPSLSDLFGKRRIYADERGLPWFVLSAKHGLLRPDDVVAPDDVELEHQSASYRSAWGVWVIERLRYELGALDDTRLEVHAGDAYAQALVGPSSAAAATLIYPLRGLRQAEQLAWYLSRSGSAGGSAPVPSTGAVAGEALCDPPAGEDTDAFVTCLGDVTRATPLEDLDELQVPTAPGLYSWWVDEPGAQALTSGLGHRVDPGLIYLGQAGATRWPSGQRSANTLRGRLIGRHRDGSVNFSTFRRTLAASLNLATAGRVDEGALTGWMQLHLAVAWRGSDDADGLATVEDDVLARLDPVLNVRGMEGTDVRLELKKRRSKRAVLAAPASMEPTTSVED